MTRHRAAAIAIHIAVALTVLGTAHRMPAFAQARTPLLMDGKTSLYQRVLTRPGAQMSAQPSVDCGCIRPGPDFGAGSFAFRDATQATGQCVKLIVIHILGLVLGSDRVWFLK